MTEKLKYWSLREVDGVRQIEFPNWDAVRLSRKQAEYFFDDKSLEFIMAGRGGGKDFLPLLKKIRRGLKRYFARRSDPTWNRPGIVWHLGVMAGESGNYADNIAKLRDFLPVIPGRSGRRPLFHYDRHEECFELFGENQFRISLISLYGEGGQRGPGYDDVLVTEAQDITEDKLHSVVIPMVIRPGYDDWCLTCVGTGKCNWFDAAVEQAMKGDPRDYYGNWAAYNFTSFDSPKMDMATAQQALREKLKNPQRFMRERLGMPNIIVPADVTPDCPMHLGLLECALYMERPVLSGPPLVVFDMMFGGEDELWRGVWNKDRSRLVHIDRWTAAELRMDKSNPFASLVKLFEDTHKKWPGCTIAYDSQGQIGGALSAHVPRHIRLVPMKRNNLQKNTQVEDFVERCAHLDPTGKFSTGIGMPHPNNPYIQAKEADTMRRLIEQVIHYRKIVTETRGVTGYYYTKGEGWGDDGMDMLTWSCSQLPPVNRRPLIVNPGNMTRALYAG